MFYSAAANEGDDEEDYIFDNDLIADTQDARTKEKMRRIEKADAQRQKERRDANKKKEKKSQQETGGTELDADFDNNHILHQMLHYDMPGGQRSLGNASTLSLGMQSSMSSSLSGVQSSISSSFPGISNRGNPLSNILQKKKIDEANAKWFSDTTNGQEGKPKK